MPRIKMALIVKARRKLILSAGEVPTNIKDQKELEIYDEQVSTLEGPVFLKVGLARAGAIYLTGAEVVNTDYPDDSLALSWYLPDEEGPEAAKPVDLAKTGLLPEVIEPEDPEEGHIWHYRLEGQSPFSETLFFDSGFQPPFKFSDLTLYLSDLTNFGYHTLVLNKILYGHRAPSYIEDDWGFPELLADGFLEKQ